MESSLIGRDLHTFSIDNRLLYGKQRKTTSIPKCTWDEPCIMGIDEAGRGPVLGPMVYGACISPVSQRAAVEAMGFNDSKVLKEEVRDRLFEFIKDQDNLSWLVDPIHPNELSNKMLRNPKENLNTISHNTAINFVRLYLAKGYNIQELYVDTVGPAQSYQDKLKHIFPQIGTIIVASKADATYPIVSAASICAKVSRDSLLKHWSNPERGVTFSETTGSGYPGDPNTKKWLRDHIDPVFGFSQLVRYSWSTAENIIVDECKPVYWIDDPKPAFSLKKHEESSRTKAPCSIRKKLGMRSKKAVPLKNK